MDPHVRVTKADFDSLKQICEGFDEEWEGAQGDAAESLKRACDIRGRTVYLQGGFCGLVGKDLRNAFADKLESQQRKETQAVGEVLCLMKERLCSFKEKTAWVLEWLLGVEAVHPLLPLNAAMLELHSQISAFITAYTNDLLTKEIVLAGITSEDAPRDAARLSLQMAAFTSQPYVPHTLLKQLLSVLQEVMLHI